MATVKRRGDGYKITVSCGYDTTGKQIRRHCTWTPEPNMTERQIQKELQRQTVLFEEQCKKGGTVSAAVKFQTLAEQWFTEYAEMNLKEKSISLLHSFERRTYAAIGHLKMGEITARHVQQFINSLNQKGANQRTGGKLSYKSQRNYLSFISSVFDYACRMDMLIDNPAKRVKLPRSDTKEREIYTLEEAQQFIDLLPTAEYSLQVFCMLAIFGGFRRGEIFGFQWGDVDFQTNTIHVIRTIQHTVRKGTYVDTPKTKGSARSVVLPPEVIALLRQYKIEQTKNRIRLGDKWQENGWILTSWNGLPIGVNTIYKQLEKFCAKHNLRYVTPHSFRHLYATLSIDAGVDIKAVSSALGHSQTSTTINIYAHTLEKAQAKASQAVADALLQKRA